MNQPNNRPVGVPGGRRFDAPSPAAYGQAGHAASGQASPRPDLGRPGVANPGPGTDLPSSETEGLLTRVESDLASVDDKSTQEQVPVFDRIHTALADAIARTADTGGSPAGGHQGA